MFTSLRRCLVAAAVVMAPAALALMTTAASASPDAAARAGAGRFQTASTLAASRTARLGPSSLPGPKTFTYTGAEQSYRVPAGVVLVRVDAVGAFGGPDVNSGGLGLTLTAYLPVRPRQVLYVEVGKAGVAGGAAGFGGGGAAGTQASGQPGAGSGGGATDVRTCSELAASCPGGITSAKSRLIVAGGGGGAGGTGSGFGSVCGMSGIAGNAGAGGGGGGGTTVTIKAGTVILASQGASVSPSVPAGGGTAKAPGGGAAGANCGTGTGNTYPNSVPGSAGSGPAGAAGANAVAQTGAGGGGGGGYFGGGSGASGQQTCNSGGCFANNNGSGGGGGSSFVTAKAPLGSFGDTSAAASVTFTPQIAITTPASHATYQQHAIVDAAWTCGGDVTGCTGTVPSGQPIDTATTGTHTFTVHGSAGGKTVAGTVTYTVG
jgi:hypothetical protein